MKQDLPPIANVEIGLGEEQAQLRVYVAKRPPVSPYQTIQQVMPLTAGEVNQIGLDCGNGWRKVFNVYSKLVFALPNTVFKRPTELSRWQDWRDRYLLQQGSSTALLFSPPMLEIAPSKPTYHVIAGRQHARTLIEQKQLSVPLLWLDEEFAINKDAKLIVSPYLDYRQLSDIKIAYLAKLLTSLS